MEIFDFACVFAEPMYNQCRNSVQQKSAIEKSRFLLWFFD